MLKKYAEQVLTEVKAIVGEDNAEIKEVTKNNGVEKIAIMVKQGNSPIGQLHYIKDDEIPADEMARMIVELSEIAETPDFNSEDVMDWIRAREKIVCNLVNTEMNKDLLQTIPHYEILDLSVTFAILVVISEDNEEAITVTNKMLEGWGVGLEELKEVALINTLTLRGLTIKSLMQMIMNLQGMESAEVMEDPMGMYVLTNNKSNRGASSILIPGVLDALAKRVGSDTIKLIPSSIHEWITIGNEAETEALTEIIGNVNDGIVDQSDLLSDHPYVYTVGGQLEIA